jgi:hypothetical protein
MATNPTVYRLSIALIVFVLLTFILTITTYLFFKQRMDERTRAQAAEKATVEKQETLMVSQQEVQKLRELIGSTEGATLETIETDLNNLFTKDFAGFTEEPKNYGRLVAWLRSEFRRKDADVKAAAEKTKAADVTATEARKQASAEIDAAQKSVQAARDDQSNDKKSFDDRWSGHEAKQTELLDAKRAAEEKSKRLESLTQKVAGAEQYLTPARQKEFIAKESAEDKLDVLYDEMRKRAAAIKEQNALLASLRVADRGLQEQVLASTPKDDRIDGIDGRIISVDEGERSVLISCGTTRGIRPGMILHVFTPDDDRPQAGDRKGVVEVTSIEGPALVRATIRRDSISTPILAGDGVATSLWAAGTAPEVVIVGYVNLDDSGGADRDRLVALVERAGARIVDAVSPTTALVVDAGRPSGARAEEGFAEEGRRQKRNLDAARMYGVRVMGIDALLDMLGLDRASLTADRLPRAAAAR